MQLFQQDLVTLQLQLPETIDILIDMDGVIVDDVAMYAKMCPHIKDMESYLRFLTIQGKRQEFVFPLIEKAIRANAFADAPSTNFLKALQSGLLEEWDKQGKNVYILTSTMSVNPLRDELQKQKEYWLDNNGLGHLQPIFVEGSAKKQDYADPTTILIDDYDRTITQFRQKGGMAIQYTTLNNTLEQLELIGLKKNPLDI